MSVDIYTAMTELTNTNVQAKNLAIQQRNTVIAFINDSACLSHIRWKRAIIERYNNEEHYLIANAVSNQSVYTKPFTDLINVLSQLAFSKLQSSRGFIIDSGMILLRNSKTVSIRFINKELCDEFCKTHNIEYVDGGKHYPY